MADGSEVDADLVGAPSGRGALDERAAVQALADAVGGAGRASALDDGHALAVAGVAPDGAFDDALPRLETASHEGEVSLLHRPLLQLPRQGGVSAVVLGDEEEPRRVLVQAVADGRQQPP